VSGVEPGRSGTTLQISGGPSEGRSGQSAELARICIRLAEDDGSSTTGNVYCARGGQGQPLAGDIADGPMQLKEIKMSTRDFRELLCWP
jgi:hypothetical protein